MKSLRSGLSGAVSSMVSRKMNQPICFIGKFATFWLMQIFAEWNYRKCYSIQKSGAVAFEFTARGRPQAETNTQGVKNVVVTMTPKTWICLKCAEEMMKEAQEEINFVRLKGPDAYRMFKALDKEDKDNAPYKR